MDNPRSKQAKIDAICDQYENDWHCLPSAQDHVGVIVNLVEQLDSAMRLDAAWELLLVDADKFEQKQMHPPWEEYLAAFPDLGSQLESLRNKTPAPGTPRSSRSRGHPSPPKYQWPQRWLPRNRLEFPVVYFPV